MNVYEAAIKRIEFIFQEFEQIVVSFSGGKDSAALAVYMKNQHPEIDVEYFFTDMLFQPLYHQITCRKIIYSIQYSLRAVRKFTFSIARI